MQIKIVIKDTVLFSDLKSGDVFCFGNDALEPYIKIDIQVRKVAGAKKVKSVSQNCSAVKLRDGTTRYVEQFTKVLRPMKAELALC